MAALPVSSPEKRPEYVTKQHLKSIVATHIKVIFNADNRAHAEERLKDFVKTYGEGQPKLAAWAAENLPEGFTVFSLPEAHRRRLRTSNTCENVNGQIKKRTRVVGLFPSEESLRRVGDFFELGLHRVAALDGWGNDFELSADLMVWERVDPNRSRSLGLA